MNTKVLIFACLATIAASPVDCNPYDYSDEADKYINQCQKELRTDFDYSDEDVDNDPKNGMKYKSKSPALQCILDCVFAKFGIIRNGNLTEDRSVVALVLELKLGREEHETIRERKFKKCYQIVNTIVGRRCGRADGLISCMKAIEIAEMDEVEYWYIRSNYTEPEFDTVGAKERKYFNECRRELRASVADLEYLQMDNDPNNEMQNCLVDCLYTKFGVIRNGKLTQDGWGDVLKSKLGREESLAMKEKKFKECYQIVNVIVGSKCGLVDGLSRCMKAVRITEVDDSKI